VLYIIAILLLILVLAIPAARNILFALLTGALGLGLIVLVLAALVMLGWGLWSIEWSIAWKALTIFYRNNANPIDIILLLTVISVAIYIFYDYRKLKKKS
jgi:hypothetical protein